ncbi:MAG: alkaline phosphatase [Bacteroidales bacterium]|nr:alkaline phosphatase [Bacteroidales bacterium]
MKKELKLFLVLALTAALSACRGKPDVKYVFYLIGDGMGINQVMATEQYNQATGKGPEQINFAHFPVRGFVTTVSASSLVTDSAAGGTALATGVKTYNSAIGVNADTVAVPSVADWAREAGAGVGIITSVGVNHATPASFVAHTDKRGNYETIATQIIETPVDFVAGGGFITEKKTGHTAAYFEDMAREAGISVFYGPAFEDMASVEGRVICLSGKEGSDLPYAIDRKEDDTSLSDLVKAGIDYLEGRFAQKGFFMMIEGGKIDYGGHGQDAATCFQELSDFANAIDLVLAFYERHPKQTLIVVTADHETGGLMLGAGKYEINPGRLAAQKVSKDALTTLFRSTFFPEGQSYKTPSWVDVKAFFARELGLWESVTVSKSAEAHLKDIYDQTFGKNGNKDLSETNLYSVNSKLVSEAVICLDNAAGFKWSYGSHSGSPVGLYVKGAGQEAFVSVKDNAEIAPTVAKLTGWK